MRSVAIEDLLVDVRVALDENTVDGRLKGLDDADTLELDRLITSKIEDGARLVELSSPPHLLGAGEPLVGVIEWESYPGHGAGSILLPCDFLRLVTFKMSDWSRGVVAAIGESSPMYALQRSRWSGVRGNPDKPVVAIVSSPLGLVLEFYSCTGGYGTSVERGRYIPVPKVADGHVPLCDKLYRAVVYRVASLTAHALGEASVGEMLEQTSNRLSETDQT